MLMGAVPTQTLARRAFSMRDLDPTSVLASGDERPA